MKIHDKEFIKYISSDEISITLKSIADKINVDYEGKNPLFVSILNGSFIVAADLFREIKLESEISFVKVSSYHDMESSGDVKKLIGLNEPIFNRDVIFIEDIVDSGRTIKKMTEEFKELGAKSVEVATLLYKPESVAVDLHVKYFGFEIPPLFVVGYGLDYNGLGRNLKDIYQLKP
ncbi:MAG: hypoxanthine phosphoribosyltransferase [Cyclobacteriaceae bacterium]|nr:hypoxanthine phosphoribosyltransferase [Cyclobacteriaceae bacterium]